MASNIKRFDELRSEFNAFVITSFKESSLQTLQTRFNENPATDTDKKAAMDQVFRDVLLTFFKAKDIKIHTLGNYITFCIESCRSHILSTTMPVLLLGDIFDALTLENCEKMFTYVEDNVSIWKEEIFFIACKNNLLRMCNDLLRRLSRSQNTVFCGRILLFLAKFFPFSERSGLNIVSEFNLENITELSNKDTDLCVKEGVEAEDEEKKVPIDYNLYCKFWSLQDYFRNPNQCYNKVQWKIITSHTTNVLAAFSSFKLEAIQCKTTDKTKLGKRTLESEDTKKEEDTHYFAKYLTNQKLLELQLSDSNFRRYVLVQFLILFQYLNSTVKFRTEGQKLTPAQVEWITETWNQVIGLLQDTPPDGKEFAKAVQHIMAREEQWSAWKNDGCKEFVKPKPPVLEAEDEAKGKKLEKAHRAKKPKLLLGNIIKECHAEGKYYMGNEHFTKLWNLCPDNLLACKGKERNFLPTLEYLENTSAAREKDSSHDWRALRLLARRSPYFFTNSNSPIHRLPEYLDTMVKRVARDSKELKHESPDTPQAIDEAETFTDQIDSDFLKESNDNDMDTNTHKQMKASEEQIGLIASKIPEWKKLALKLGYQIDEVVYFGAANKMLEHWFNNDVDASLDNLAYILEGLEMIEATEVIKSFESNT